jgi:hypothetical protein
MARRHRYPKLAKKARERKSEYSGGPDLDAACGDPDDNSGFNSGFARGGRKAKPKHSGLKAAGSKSKGHADRKPRSGGGGAGGWGAPGGAAGAGGEGVLNNLMKVAGGKAGVVGWMPAP